MPLWNPPGEDTATSMQVQRRNKNLWRGGRDAGGLGRDRQDRGHGRSRLGRLEAAMKSRQGGRQHPPGQGSRRPPTRAATAQCDLPSTHPHTPAASPRSPQAEKKAVDHPGVPVLQPQEQLPASWEKVQPHPPPLRGGHTHPQAASEQAAADRQLDSGALRGTTTNATRQCLPGVGNGDPPSQSFSLKGSLGVQPTRLPPPHPGQRGASLQLPAHTD